MTNLGSGFGDAPDEDTSGELRIGDAERQAVVDMLSRHAAAGRLTLDEFAERAGRVFAARTRADLTQVVTDLPADLPTDPGVDRGTSGQGPHAGYEPLTAASGWGPEAAVDKPSRRRRRKRRFVAIMSGASARGRWWAPRKIRAFAWWGGVKIDLRHAVISSPEVHIKASAYMGHVLVIVPDGIPVDMYGFVLMGGSANRAASAAAIQGAPLVRVKARGLWGGVTVRSGKQQSAWLKKQQAAQGGPGKQHRHHLPHDGHKHDLGHDRAFRHEDRRAPTADEPTRARQPDEGRHPGWAAGELPSPTLHDALPLLDDLPGVAHAKSKLRDKLLAAAELFEESAESPGRPGTRQQADATDEGAEPSGSTPRNGAPANDPATDPETSHARLPLGTMTILVTDIVGSTQLARTLGDQRWLEVLRHHNELVREQVANNDGTEVKAQGDGFMMVFPSARKAILASVDIQRAMAKYRADDPHNEIELRIGLHTGEVVTDDNDIHGQNVVTAVRIADAAGPNEILVSGITRDLTASAGDLRFDAGREVPLKGFAASHRVHPVSWA